MIFNIAIGNTAMNKKKEIRSERLYPLTTIYNKEMRENNLQEEIDSQLVKALLTLSPRQKLPGQKYL
ncbi:hypothetical protein [Paraflavitalea speifideaquila]|uniref:hypothetical protein n=1 Tax=Paraflavitalea speifideaquila TaxID=3076558 RepID=UPI0028E888BF|nr:hypothetical protein [Paraflavitalea speifideiaquila]